MYGYAPKDFQVRKQNRKLSHEQKRQFAKEIIRGGHIKQTAANWHISLHNAYMILSKYTVVFRAEAFPDE